LADLKGQKVYVLKSREACRLFAEKGAGGNPSVFFGKLIPARIPEDALDDVLRGKVQAAIVDSAALEIYKEVNPGRYDRLRVAARSEPFPPTVVAYYEGALNDQELRQFRTGMMKANESEKGREAMSSVSITAFQAVPANLPEVLREIAKAYPPPETQQPRSPSGAGG